MITTILTCTLGTLYIVHAVHHLKSAISSSSDKPAYESFALLERILNFIANFLL